jgi:hypothetical protein
VNILSAAPEADPAIKYCIADGTCNIFCNNALLLSGTMAF